MIKEILYPELRLVDVLMLTLVGWVCAFICGEPGLGVLATFSVLMTMATH